MMTFLNNQKKGSISLHFLKAISFILLIMLATTATAGVVICEAFSGNSFEFHNAENSTSSSWTPDLPTIKMEEGGMNFMANEATINNTRYRAILTGSQEVCPKITTGYGTIDARLRGKTLTLSGSFSGLIGDFDASIGGGAHIHQAITGRNGDIIIGLNTDVNADLRGGHYRARENTFELTDEQYMALKNRELYVNIHTTIFPSGEIRGQLLPRADYYFQSNLLGINEVPANTSSATGNVLFELKGKQLIASGSFDDFNSQVATDLAGGAHIHLAPAGQNGDINITLNLDLDDDKKGGTFSAANNTFTLTSEQINSLKYQQFYVNAHSEDYRSGEVRGQIVPLATAYFNADLSGGQEVPPISVTSDGRIIVTYNANNTITVSGSFNNLESDLNTALAGGAHLHLAPRGENGDIIFPLAIQTTDNRSGVFLPQKNTFTLSGAQKVALFNEEIYANVHSIVNASGEVRGQLEGLTIAACGNPDPPIITPSVCQTPSNPKVTKFHKSKLVIKWEPVTNAKRYVIQARIKGRTGWAITAFLHYPRATVWALPNQDFEYRLKTICRDNSESEYSEVYTFDTRKDFNSTVATSRSGFNPDLDFNSSENTALQYQVRPNPVTTSLELLYQSTSDNTQLSIYHLNGKKVIEVALPSNHSVHSVDIESLESGLYILTVEENNRKVISKQIVKQSQH